MPVPHEPKVKVSEPVLPFEKVVVISPPVGQQQPAVKVNGVVICEEATNIAKLC